ncbi:hypothetical protein Phab24_id036 [Acinetobacter phage Phab24]|nr:hypothetical protein Phab24_id036 [Acinetobacter phage Phab24]
MSYHKIKIHKHNVESIFKLQEEFFEYLDAVANNNPIMAVQELSDLYGCLENEITKYGMSMEDLRKMSDLTKSVFTSGFRKVTPMIEYLKNNSESIKCFGLGFVQVKCGNFNYNFYSDRVEKFSNYEAPHNHQQDFFSEILKGELKETLYIFEEGSNVGFCGCGDKTKTVNYKYKEDVSLNHTQGDLYLRLKDEYHSVLGTHGTVTKVYKIGSKSDAYVLSENTLHNNIIDYSVDQLWSIVEEVWNV